LKLKHDQPLSNFAFRFSLRRYNKQGFEKTDAMSRLENILKKYTTDYFKENCQEAEAYTRPPFGST